MKIKKIKELIDLMNENDLTEIEVEEEGQKIKLSKKAQKVEQTIVSAQSAKSSDVEALAGAQTKIKSNVKEVKSPMVGTFYRSASPDVDPYVEVGDIVNKGEVLCIVEAMKLMNEVKAEFGGKIVEISIENAEAVEFGQTLFFVEPV